MNLIKLIKNAAFAQPANIAPLDRDDFVWFNDLKNQFKTFEPPEGEVDTIKAKAKTEIRRVIGPKDNERKNESLTQQDLADLETWLIELLPLEDLRQKVNSLRDDYREMAGDDCWNKILPTLTNQVSTADEKTLRAEARRLQQELHWRGSIQPEAQRIRVTLMLKVSGMFIAVLIFALAMVIWNFSTLGGIIIMAGTLGALISSIQRIQSADLCSSRATSLAKSDHLTLGVAISPLLGGIFAILFVLLLLTRQVSPGFVIPDVTVSCPPDSAATNSTNAPTRFFDGNGSKNQSINIDAKASAEPTLTNSTNGTTGMSNTIRLQTAGNSTGSKTISTDKAAESGVCTHDFFGLDLCSKTAKDLILLILWAFAAGFSERLVPDLLTRLADTKKS